LHQCLYYFIPKQAPLPFNGIGNAAGYTDAKDMAISFCNPPNPLQYIKHMFINFTNSIISKQSAYSLITFDQNRVLVLFFQFYTRFTQNYFFCSFVFISGENNPLLLLFCKASIVNRVWLILLNNEKQQLLYNRAESDQLHNHLI
jgi:hypothetical protein